MADTPATPPTFGRYQAQSVLGAGAMGTVWKALDPQLGREVAVKTIKREILGLNPALRTRFEREARIVAALSHPAIVQVYDAGEDYLVMELVRGKELRDLVKSGRRYTPAEIAALITTIAGGLDHAHERGVVHRDIKPANLFIEEDGRPRIADFGVAKLKSEAAEGLTGAGEILGTPKYMSPEQVRSEPVDGRSDQFSLAVVAYELLAGRAPFAAESISGLLYKIIHDPPPPLPAETGLPPAVEGVLRRALDKTPAGRFPTCAAFAAALRGATAGLAPASLDEQTAPTLTVTPAPAALAASTPPSAAELTALLRQQGSWLIAFGAALSAWLTATVGPWAQRQGGAFMSWLSGRAVPALDRGVRAGVNWLDGQLRVWRARLTGPQKRGWGALVALVVLLLGALLWRACHPRRLTPGERLRKGWKEFRGSFK